MGAAVCEKVMTAILPTSPAFCRRSRPNISQYFELRAALHEHMFQEATCHFIRSTPGI
jgi:hypothetical protein